jgi:hypothetical protein
MISAERRCNKGMINDCAVLEDQWLTVNQTSKFSTVNPVSSLSGMPTESRSCLYTDIIIEFMISLNYTTFSKLAVNMRAADENRPAACPAAFLNSA